MIKKLFLSLVFSVFLFPCIFVNASDHQPAYGNGWYITYSYGRYAATHCYVGFTEWLYDVDPNNITLTNTFNYMGYYSTPFTSESYDECVTYIQEHYADLFYSDTLTNSGFLPNQALYSVGIPFRIAPSEEGEYYLTYGDAFESDDDQTASWFKRIWDFIMDNFGITDDFSNDLYDWIIEEGDGDGGHSGGHSFDIVTPSPIPSPTPFPTPTPFSVDVIDTNTGQPVYSITGIPGQTIIINQGDNINNSSDDFDIFDVDLKIGDNGTSNPRDGINSIIDSNYDYVSDIDTSSVAASFSILPDDWFIMIGVLICFPFLAGFISKLLK